MNKFNKTRYIRLRQEKVLIKDIFIDKKDKIKKIMYDDQRRFIISECKPSEYDSVDISNKTMYIEEWSKKPIYDIEKHNINTLLDFAMKYDNMTNESIIKLYGRCIGNFFEAKELKQKGDKSGRDVIYLKYHLSEYYDIMGIC